MGLSVTVVGGGNWGTALANHLAKLGKNPSLVAKDSKVVEAINKSHVNPKYLPSTKLHSELRASTEKTELIKKADVIVIAIPCQTWRSYLEKQKKYFNGRQIIVSCSKGIENESLKLISEVVDEILPSNIANNFTTLAGPSFAKEVLEEQPTAVTVAGKDNSCVETIQNLFHGKNLRVYSSSDLIGVEISGALKNVVAIATGIADGLGFGYNSRAALITRGLAEILRIGLAKGAQTETLLGLSGVGDLVLTCTGELSRNRTVGFRLGKGEILQDILTSLGQVSEGVTTTKSAYYLTKKLKIETPIIDEIYKILYEDKQAIESLQSLMERHIRPETEIKR
ncbi:NAD(P)H-dependent glycerol-3-phosphate dehydrogenase [Bdellovibrionota bacterium]